MNEKRYEMIAGAIFLLIAVAHVLRIAFNVEWIVEGRVIPICRLGWLGIQEAQNPDAAQRICSFGSEFVVSIDADHLTALSC